MITITLKRYWSFHFNCSFRQEFEYGLEPCKSNYYSLLYKTVNPKDKDKIIDYYLQEIFNEIFLKNINHFFSRDNSKRNFKYKIKNPCCLIKYRILEKRYKKEWGAEDICDLSEVL